MRKQKRNKQIKQMLSYLSKELDKNKKIGSIRLSNKDFEIEMITSKHLKLQNDIDKPIGFANSSLTTNDLKDEENFED